MASMFRAVKYETIEDIEKEFQQKKQLAVNKAKDMSFIGDIDPSTNAEQPQSSSDGAPGKVIQSDEPFKDEIKLMQQASVQQAMNEAQKKRKAGK